jgi:hypothetical protein
MRHLCAKADMDFLKIAVAPASGGHSGMDCEGKGVQRA